MLNELSGSEKKVKSNVLVFTATYNEAGNISQLLKEIWSVLPAADILVVDDNSPDGTGKILDQIAEERSQLAAESKLNVIHRPGKMGVGSAHKLAIKYARDNDYDALVTMDADFSHDPKVLPLLILALEGNSFVIGSRFTEGGSLNYTGFRRFISIGANWLSRFLLGVRCRETTTSYRAFSRELLQNFSVDTVQSEGYSFFLECTYYVSQVAASIREVPIHFEDRRYGQSKISQKEILVGFQTVVRLGFDRVLRLVGLRPSLAMLVCR